MIRNIFPSAIFFILLSFPMILFSVTAAGLIRFTQGSAFSTNAIWWYPIVFLKNYISYFSLTYLFTIGDQINRHQVQDTGLLYLWQLPCIIVGIFVLVKRKKSILLYWIIFILVIAPIPGSMVLPSPHSLRARLSLIPYTLLTVYGLSIIYDKIKRKYIVIAMLCIVMIYQSLDYFHLYFDQYSRAAILDWGAGYQQLAYQVKELHGQYDEIVADSQFEFINEYFTFYNTGHTVKIIKYWQKDAHDTKRVLSILPQYKNHRDGENIVQTVYIPNQNHDVFAKIHAY